MIYPEFLRRWAGVTPWLIGASKIFFPCPAGDRIVFSVLLCGGNVACPAFRLLSKPH
jgi:hypothetical protein